MENKQGIKIVGRTNTWSAIDQTYWKGVKVYLMENDVWGDETCCVIVDTAGNVVLDDVYNGFEDLYN